MLRHKSGFGHLGHIYWACIRPKADGPALGPLNVAVYEIKITFCSSYLLFQSIKLKIRSFVRLQPLTVESVETALS